MLWDIFCKVIDNHGDIGVSWRVSRELAGRGEQVRLWVDDASALAWMAPNGAPGVEVLAWDVHSRAAVEPGEVVVEAFGCHLTLPFQAEIAAAARARGRQPAWINLEYLTAESFAERTHGLPSPVLAGPAAGLVKHFFYPGFTPRTGGLPREKDLLELQAAFDARHWLRAQGIPVRDGAERVSLFCYEPPALQPLLAAWAARARPTDLLVTAGRAAAAVRTAVAAQDKHDRDWNAAGRLAIFQLPLLSQIDFDHLLWACDLNFVRGEDSLVRALWAGKPMLWQIYPQHDDAHHAKLSAFLDWLGAPSSLREFHEAWNGISANLPAFELRDWSAPFAQARQRLLEQDDLSSQLMRFVGELKSR